MTGIRPVPLLSFSKRRILLCLSDAAVLHSLFPGKYIPAAGQQKPSQVISQPVTCDGLFWFFSKQSKKALHLLCMVPLFFRQPGENAGRRSQTADRYPLSAGRRTGSLSK